MADTVPGVVLKTKVYKPKKPTEHPKYSEMVKAAIAELKNRGGSSRRKILKYILSNYKVGEEKTVNTHLKIALRTGVKSGLLDQSKGTGASGSFRLSDAAKKAPANPKKLTDKKPAAKKPADKKPVDKNPAEKKATNVKKPKSPGKKATKVQKPKSPGKNAIKIKKPKSLDKKTDAKKPTKKQSSKKSTPKKPKSAPANKSAIKKPVQKTPKKVAKKPAKN